ncbi:MAG: ATP-binding cassette domain-containing protein [Clostridium sp.]|nr:ATP-binding cassette domain-containing protein [Clostridium sp.]
MEKIKKEPLLKTENLKEYFKIPGKGYLHAVDNISIEIMPNETLGLVGESGCGKSTVGNTLMRLLEPTGGKIFYKGEDITNPSKKKKLELTKKTQMVFQDPYSSLNPRKTIRSILAEPFIINKAASGSELDNKVNALAKRVGLEEYVLGQFPHELDGGKRQMVGIARALAMNPEFIVCDEPVSALDVSVQATIINLLIDMQKEMKLSYLFISHDLSVVRHISDRVAVMYLGQIVELAETDTIFSNTLHPYSIALLSAVPKIQFDRGEERIVLTGDVPSPMNPKPGCRFAPRCWMACEECKNMDQHLEEAEEGHFVACMRWKEMREKADIKTRS